MQKDSRDSRDSKLIIVVLIIIFGILGVGGLLLTQDRPNQSSALNDYAWEYTSPLSNNSKSDYYSTSDAVATGFEIWHDKEELERENEFLKQKITESNYSTVELMSKLKEMQFLYDDLKRTHIRLESKFESIKNDTYDPHDIRQESFDIEKHSPAYQVLQDRMNNRVEYQGQVKPAKQNSIYNKRPYKKYDLEQFYQN